MGTMQRLTESNIEEKHDFKNKGKKIPVGSVQAYW